VKRTSLPLRRREFIALLSGAAASPLVVRAQPSAMPVIGFVRSTSLSDSTQLVTAFRQGLKELGFVEGQNVAIEYRWAEGQYDRLRALVADLVDRKVAVIAANSPSALAAKHTGAPDTCSERQHRQRNQYGVC